MIRPRVGNSNIYTLCAEMHAAAAARIIVSIYRFDCLQWDLCFLASTALCYYYGMKFILKNVNITTCLLHAAAAASAAAAAAAAASQMNR